MVVACTELVYRHLDAVPVDGHVTVCAGGSGCCQVCEKRVGCGCLVIVLLAKIFFMTLRVGASVICGQCD